MQPGHGTGAPLTTVNVDLAIRPETPMLKLRPLLALPCALALAFGGAALAQDDKAEDATEKVEEVVEERAEDEEAEPEDADLGEASYNTADCREDGEDASPGTDGEDEDVAELERHEDGGDPDSDAEAGERDMDECEPGVK